MIKSCFKNDHATWPGGHVAKIEREYWKRAKVVGKERMEGSGRAVPAHQFPIAKFAIIFAVSVGFL